MSRDRWQRLESLFHGALEQPEAHRREWLEAACGDDPELRDEVLRLLEADRNTAPDPAAAVVSAAVTATGSAAETNRGHRIGPWRILEELGVGGMGTVLLAERADDEYRRKVAIKLIRGFPDSAALERLRTERQILADLTHPNIAALLDGGTTEAGQPYLVMEYIEGTRIDHWCEGRPATEIVRLMVDLCDAIHYAHQHLVIHRDIKPGNVLVTAEGRPVVLDFGIAKLLPADGEETDEHTRAGHFYTPGFASPEQLAGRPVSTASDLFSLGRLTGRITERFRDRELDAIVARATRERPGDRYSGVAAMRADLERYLKGLPVSAAAHRRGYRVLKFLSRHRVPVAASVLVLALSAAAVWQIVQESHRARAAEASARLEAANAEQTLEFLVGLIEAAAPGQSRGESVTVTQMVHRGREQIRNASLEDPSLRARMMFALGDVYKALEDYPAAIELLADSARLARSQADTAAEARALSVLGVTRTLAGELDEASHALERARILAEGDYGLSPALRADILNSWGVWANAAGRPEAAREELTRALETRRALDLAPETIAATLHNLALSEMRLGDFRAAYERISEALELKRASIGRLHPSYAISLRIRAITARELGRFDLAREDAREVLEIRSQLLGADHPGLHIDYNELANAHHDLGEYQQAIAMYREALERASAADPDRVHYVVLNNLAAAHEDRGDPAAAEPLYRESLAARIEQLGPDHAGTLRTRHNLARVLLHMGNIEAAEAVNRETLAGRLAVLGEDHPDTLRSRFQARHITWARQPDDPEQVAALARTVDAMAAVLPENGLAMLNARGELGRAWLEAGDHVRAREQLEAAIGGYREAFGPEHPVAAALELELARMEILDRSPGAGARLGAVRPVLEQRLVPGARALRQLACLEDGVTDPDCWQETGAFTGG